MSRTIVTRSIKAPVDVVFATISDINRYVKAVPHIIRVEFLSDIRSGVGAKFRETRLMKSKEVATELEVTEFVENDKIRMVADSGGTIWDTLFSVRSASGGTELKLVMDATPHELMARIINPLIKPLVKKGIEQDMDAVKAYCEA